MHTITFQLLQTPQILIDQIPVTFPFKKAEALVYYIAVKKSVSREEAAALFWFDNDETTARKNLRHALYIIKKSFGADIIISPKKHTLLLNPEFAIKSDYDDFISKSDYHIYKGEFLKGFFIKNAEEFDSWLSLERTSLKNTYLRSLYQTMKNLPVQNVSEMESCFSLYLEEDALDERIYYLMMKTYQENELYHKGIKIYQSLYRLLNTELYITPSREITVLHKELLNSWTECTALENRSDADFLVEGREKETQFLQNSYHHFLAGTPAAILLSGENGVGKTYLMNHFLDNLDYDSPLILRAICFQEEKSASLQPWNTIMLQLDHYISDRNLKIPEKHVNTINHSFPLLQSQELPLELPEDINISYNYRATCNSILKLFFLIGKEVPIILAFDNIHYMDLLSLELLSLLIREQDPNIMILATSLNHNIPSYITPLVKEHMITILEVKPFSRKEVELFVRRKIKDTSVDSSILDLIYQETAGNAYFLDLLVNNLSKENLEKKVLPSVGFQDALSERLSGLSKEARQILDIISLFHDYAIPDVLENILNKNSLELLSFLDELREHGLICETVHNNTIQITFRHNSMRTFVHNQLSPSKLRILHSRVAAYYEESISDHPGGYQNLIYHYNMCGNEPKVLQYQILQLEKYSNIHFELYPILAPQSDPAWEAPAGLTDLMDKLKERLYSLYELSPNSIDYSEYEARLLHLIGKYHIAQGNYDKGVPVIRKLLVSNEYVKLSPGFHILCLRQMTFYGIQIWNTSLMEKHIRQCIILSKENLLTADLAIEYRLKGLLYSMTGNYKQSAECLMDAIKLFKSSTLKAQSYALNIAACYNYLGEVMRKQQQFAASLKYYQKAIDTCRSRKCAVNATFYVNKARTYLAMGQKRECMQTFLTANEIYDDTLTLMGRSIARGYAAVFHAQKGDYKKAELYLKKAGTNAQKLGSPQELGLLYLIQSQLVKQYPEYFKNLLTESADFYLNKAVSYLNPLPGIYELQNAASHQ